MRVKRKVNKKISLKDAMDEFLAYKQAQKVRERTVKEYQYYLQHFLATSSGSLNIETLKEEIIKYFAEIPITSPARYNHPYQYLHALFNWCAKQDYIPYNPFDKLDLKKQRDDGTVQPAEIQDIQHFLKCMDKHSYTELRDYTITLLILDTGIRTSEVLGLINDDYSPENQSIMIRPEVSKTSRARIIFLSTMTNTAIKKFLRVKPREWENWLFPTRDGLRLQSNVLARNFRKYCNRAGVKFTPYQLRHSFATLYLKNGGDLFTLQKQMGHADLQMTRRYTEITDDQVHSSHSAYSPIALLQNTRRKVNI